MIRFFSLRTRFVFAVVTLLLIIGSVLTIYIHTSLKQSLSLQVQKRGVAIAHSLARMAVNPSLTENSISLQLLTYDFRRGEEDVDYVFIVDQHGRVVAHTFGAGFPEGLATLNQLKAGETQRVRQLKAEKGRMYDIAVPIMQGDLGTVHVGLNWEAVQQGVRQFAWQATGLLIGLMILACCGAVFLAGSLSRPIETLIASVEALGEGNLQQRISADERDEIGLLAAAINRMAENLEETTVSRNEVEILNHQLEDIVAERTEQLVRINEELAQEVAERRHAEETIRQLNENLEERIQERTQQLQSMNQELEAFSYSVSHDLYAPLRHIEAFSSMLMEDHLHQLDQQGVHFLGRIKAGVVKMGTLIDALLKLSRMGRQELVFQEFDLSLLAQNLVQQLKESDPQRQVNVTVAPGISVRGDRTLLAVVLQNLLENAWKFTAQRESAEIEFGSTETDGEQTIFVRDNGIGFDMQHAGNLFGVFRRLVSESEFPGTGIGLATVQRIIARHGGRVWAEGLPGAGATFYFTL